MELETDPVNIVLLISGSRGDRLLFRYPFHDNAADVEVNENLKEDFIESDKIKEIVTNPPSRGSSASTRKLNPLQVHSSTNEGGKTIRNGLLFGYPDNILANILTPKMSLCGVNFELKIDEAMFVGYPMKLDSPPDAYRVKKGTKAVLKEDVVLKMFNVVLVLKDTVSQSVMNHYENLCKMLAIALRHEERSNIGNWWEDNYVALIWAGNEALLRHWCSYLSKERELMVGIQDEESAMPEDCILPQFYLILAKSKLAQDLKMVFDSLCDSGMINIHINSFINISFCLPHKVHKNDEGKLKLEPDLFSSYASRTRPYHTVLLLDDEKNLVNSLPIDCSPALKRLIKMSSPMKNFQKLSQDADIALSQIFHLVSHLVYWGKAMVIYPLAESNVYVISEDTPMSIDSKIAEKFHRKFAGKSRDEILRILARFSFPTTLGEYRNPLSSIQQQREQVQIVTWLLKHQLLKQLHTYVYLMPQPLSDGNVSSDDEDFNFEDLAGPDVTNKVSWNMLSVFEQKSVLRLKKLLDVEDIQFFLRICPYFRGDHHLEEIMYYENIRRSEILALIDKFRSMLITTQHEDPATVYRV